MMYRTQPQFRLSCLSLLLAGVLSGCGGGVIDKAEATNPVDNSNGGADTSTGGTETPWWSFAMPGLSIEDESDAIEMNAETAELTAEDVIQMGSRWAQVEALRVDGKPLAMPPFSYVPDMSKKQGQKASAKEVLAGDATAATRGVWSGLFETGMVAIHASLMPGKEMMLFGTYFDGQADVKRHAFEFATLREGEAFVRYDGVKFSTNAFCAATVQTNSGELIIAGGTNASTDTAKKGYFGDKLLAKYTGPVKEAAPTLTNLGAGLKTARWYPSIHAMPSGKILLVGGKDELSQPVYTPELLDPVTGESTLLEGINQKGTGWTYPRLLSYDENKVVVLSGSGKTYLMNVTGKSISLIKNFTEKGNPVSSIPNGPAVPIGDNRYLVAGSYSANLATTKSVIVTVKQGEKADVVMEATGAMVHGRSYHDMTLLADGSVLATGGLAVSDEKKPWKANEAVRAAELWRDGVWTEMASEDRIRGYHGTALLLPSGAVAKMGADRPANETNYHGQIFYPPYLYNADGSPRTRPEISTAEITAGTGRGTLTVTLADGTGIKAVNAIRLGSVTHQQNFGQRFVKLTFTSSVNAAGQRVLVSEVPASVVDMPPGYYMIFPIADDGTPVKEASILLF